MSTTATITYDRVYIKTWVDQDDDADYSYLDADNDPEYAEQNAKRLQAARDGEWSLVTVGVTAYGETDSMLSWEHHELAHDCIGGVESDDTEYIKTLYAEMTTSAIETLANLGIQESDVEYVN